MNQETGLVRVAQDGFVDAVTTVTLGVDDIEAERRLGDAVDLAIEIPAFVVKERFTVGKQELQVTNLRRVDGWIVNLGYASVIECVPDSPRRRISGSHRHFCAAAPARFDAGTAGRKTLRNAIEHNYIFRCALSQTRWHLRS